MKSLSLLHKMMARAVALEGADNRKLREITDYSENHIYKIVNDPLFLEEVDRLVGDIEEHEITKKKEALSVAYDNLKGLMEKQVNIGLKGKTETVQSQAIDRVMSFIFRKKDLEPEDKKQTKYVAIQLKEDMDKLNADPDINPDMNKNIVKFDKVADL